MKNNHDAIIGLSFGKSERVNGRLAEIISQVWRETGKDIPYVINQIEIAQKYNGGGYQKVISNHRQEGKYLDTIEVLEQSKAFLFKVQLDMVDKDWDEIIKTVKEKGGDLNPPFVENNIILIAHSLHFHRAWKTAEKLGFKVSQYKVGKIPLDKNDSQWWCRNRLFFTIWNLAGWGKYLLMK